jgi:hypothetical protein
MPVESSSQNHLIMLDQTISWDVPLNGCASYKYLLQSLIVHTLTFLFSLVVSNPGSTLGFFDVLHVMTFSCQCLLALVLLPMYLYCRIGKCSTAWQVLYFNQTFDLSSTCNRNNQISNTDLQFLHFSQCLIMQANIPCLSALSNLFNVSPLNRYSIICAFVMKCHNLSCDIWYFHMKSTLLNDLNY